MAGGKDRDERDAFERAMEGVRPLAKGKERVPAPRPRPSPRPRHASEGESREASFVAEGEADEAGFYASDLGRDPLLRLRRGEVAIGFDLDLHQYRADEARRTVERTLARAVSEGARGGRIVHGKGLHSAGAAVLRDAIREELLRPPLSQFVAAIVFAPPRLGGSGATLVCLRRKPRKGRT